MGAEEVHGTVERLRRVVLPQRLHALPEGCGVAAAQPRQQCCPEGIVHQTVGLPPQKIPAAAGIGDLVAAVLPDLAQQVRARLFRVHGGADALDEVAGQLVRHVQPPAVGTAAKPAAHHAVLAAEDEVAVVRTLLVDGGQRPHAPPRVVLRRPRVEAVPAEVGGFPALRRAQLRVVALCVKIPAVAAGVVEYAVNDDAHPPLVGLAAQGTEVLLRAQQGVDAPVIRRVVPVVAGGLENGVEIQRRHVEALEIVQLLRDPRQ